MIIKTSTSLRKIRKKVGEFNLVLETLISKVVDVNSVRNLGMNLQVVLIVMQHSSTNMKILLITGENDYDAVEFENRYSGQHVDKLIKKLKNGETLSGEVDGEEWDIAYRIIDVPDIVISKEFRDFIKDDVLDYDAGKHCNFYLETDIVK